jgi:hypothetical protein
MIHARPDYERFQDPALDNPELYPGVSPIAQDEPVFVVRAKDKNMRDVLLHYLGLLSFEDKPDPVMQRAIIEHIRRVESWQTTYGSKTPDMPTPEGY